ncbi:MAG: hypothetical protein AABZ00_16345 [Chloroflexota bacterium]
MGFLRNLFGKGQSSLKTNDKPINVFDVIPYSQGGYLIQRPNEKGTHQVHEIEGNSVLIVRSASLPTIKGDGSVWSRVINKNKIISPPPKAPLNLQDPFAGFGDEFKRNGDIADSLKILVSDFKKTDGSKLAIVIHENPSELFSFLIMIGLIDGNFLKTDSKPKEENSSSNQ